MHSSPKSLFFAAYIYALHLLTKVDDIVVGLVSFNRPARVDGDKLLGCFLNTVPLRVKIPVNPTWREFIALIDQRILEIKRYEVLSLFEISRAIGGGTPGTNPLFDTLFNF